MSSIDQTFVEYIVKSLVGKPDSVQIERRIDEKGVLLELSVDPEDLGRVIGKRGATAQSIRTLLRALGTKNEARYNLKIIDTAEQSDSDTSDESSTPAPDESKSKAADNETDDAVTDESNEEPAATADKDDTTEDTEEESDSLKKAKQELADLDDLDI